jgi:hypothetical protein
MPDDRTPLYLSLVAATLMIVAVVTVQPYSADWPGRGFVRPAERYVRAALAQDSVALARLSVADSPVVWALAMGRRNAGFLTAWAHHTSAFTGERRGDTTQVFVYSGAAACGDAPIQFRFVDRPGGVRVVAAALTCRDSAPARRTLPRP